MRPAAERIPPQGARLAILQKSAKRSSIRSQNGCGQINVRPVTQTIDQGTPVGQFLTPSVPADAVSWTPAQIQFAAGQSDRKLGQILHKTWGKMTPQGQEHARGLLAQLPEEASSQLAEALQIAKLAQAASHTSPWCGWLHLAGRASLQWPRWPYPPSPARRSPRRSLS